MPSIAVFFFFNEHPQQIYYLNDKNFDSFLGECIALFLKHMFHSIIIIIFPFYYSWNVIVYVSMLTLTKNYMPL